MRSGKPGLKLAFSECYLTTHGNQRVQLGILRNEVAWSVFPSVILVLQSMIIPRRGHVLSSACFL